MHYKEHLVFSGIVNGIFLFILYKVFSVNIFQTELIFPLLITFYIFSILPDIDHPASHVSRILYLFLIYLVGSSVYSFYKTFNPIDLLKIALAVGIFIVHIKYAEDSYLHRRFPHTFTFGVIACIILYILVNSTLVIIVGAISFFTHILGDSHFNKSVERDKEIWRLIGFKIKKMFGNK